MIPIIIKRTGLALALTVAGSLSAFSTPYDKGEKVEAFQAQTQHGQAFTFKAADTRYLLVTHDMDTGKKANAVLTTVGKENLEKKKVVYLANIHGMPGVGRMFALPKMKKYSHTIVLGDDEKLIARFPAETGKVTVLALNGGKVSSVKYWSPASEALDDYLK